MKYILPFFALALVSCGYEKPTAAPVYNEVQVHHDIERTCDGPDAIYTDIVAGAGVIFVVQNSIHCVKKGN